MTTAFDRDLDRWMDDPEFSDAYRRERARVDAIDRIVRSLDVARIAQGWTKAQLAAAAGVPAQSVRRFFTKGGVNPTLGLTVAIAAALNVDLAPVATAGRPAAGRGGWSAQDAAR